LSAAYGGGAAPLIASATSGRKIVMKNLIPCHINDVESDRRAVKNGWYAINDTGKLRSGPFSSRPACLEDIAIKNAQTAAREEKAASSVSIPYWMEQFPN
jgi:hypothetical protein